MVVAAATGINLVLGFLYSWSVIKKVLVSQMHWSNFDASLPFTVAALGLALTMVGAGRLQDVFGPRLAASIGGTLFGLGLIASAWVTSPLGVVLTYGAMGGIGLGMCYASATPASVKWFPPAKRGMITGIVVSGVGMASVYTAPLTNWLLEMHGLSNTFLYLGIAALILMVGFAQFLKNPPDAAAAPAAQTVSATPSESAWRQTIQTPSFYKLWLMYGFSASAGMMMISHLATIAKTQAQWENGFYLVALLALFNTIGRIAAGYWSDSFGYTRTMLVVFCLQALNMLLFSFYVTPMLLAIGTAFTGLSYGALFSLFPAATADYYGVKNLGVNYGMVFTAWGLAGIIGPLVAGWVVDTTGSYNLSYIFCAALLVLAAGLSFFTAHPSKKSAASAVPVAE
jgi:OFA family oxalate/formate antiporter-like MFS transporter